MTAPRMRTITALAAHYKELDPDSAITAHFLRARVLGGEIPCVRAGTKRLVSIEAVDRFLVGVDAAPEPEQRGTIRPIAG